MNVYITGTDRGLGLALTAKFLEEGFQVFAGKYGIEGRFLDELKEKYGENLQIVPLDVSSDESVAKAASIIKSKTDKLDLLINNAGIIGKWDSILDDTLDFDDMLHVYSVNALGPLRVSKSVLDLLLKGSMKRIINISSEAGSMTRRIEREEKIRYAYCASKSALNMQSIILQNHIKEFGIKVYLLEPGWMRTYMSGTKSLKATSEPEESADKVWEFINRQNQPDYMFHDLYQNKRFEW